MSQDNIVMLCAVFSFVCAIANVAFTWWVNRGR